MMVLESEEMVVIAPRLPMTSLQQPPAKRALIDNKTPDNAPYDKTKVLNLLLKISHKTVIAAVFFLFFRLIAGTITWNT